MQALNTATAGMLAATGRLGASAQRTAAWSLDGARSGSDTDLVKETVEQVSAKTDFKANAAVAKTADEMMGALLDIKA
jgi:flagellar hook protein FlgE